jgi:uncharacterized LabA/DUF88 family protein
MNRNARLENLTKAAIFVDVQDMYYSAYSTCKSKIDYTKLLKFLAEGHDIAVANAYLLFGKDVDFSKFESMLRMSGFDVKKKIQETYNDKAGEENKTKTAKFSPNWEIGMTIDMIKWSKKVDCIILVSGNLRFIDTINYIKNETRVVVAAFDRFASTRCIKDVCDEFIDLCPKAANDMGVLIDSNAVEGEDDVHS